MQNLHSPFFLTGTIGKAQGLQFSSITPSFNRASTCLSIMGLDGLTQTSISLRGGSGYGNIAALNFSAQYISCGGNC